MGSGQDHLLSPGKKTAMRKCLPLLKYFSIRPNQGQANILKYLQPTSNQGQVYILTYFLPVNPLLVGD